MPRGPVERARYLFVEALSSYCSKPDVTLRMMMYLAHARESLVSSGSRSICPYGCASTASNYRGTAPHRAQVTTRIRRWRVTIPGSEGLLQCCIDPGMTSSSCATTPLSHRDRDPSCSDEDKCICKMACTSHTFFVRIAHSPRRLQ